MSQIHLKSRKYHIAHGALQILKFNTRHRRLIFRRSTLSVEQLIVADRSPRALESICQGISLNCLIQEGYRRFGIRLILIM
jgi:hypothetical protein